MDKYDFTEKNLSGAPNEHGVYLLYQNGMVIYIGRAAGTGVTIRSRLRDHHSGREGKCTQSADSYSREATPTPIKREQELLAWYKENHNNRLPACNDVMP